MEKPQYAEINDAELKEIEAELGHPVTRQLAQWSIRNRLNREAVERMLEAAKTDREPNLQNLQEITRSKTRKQVSILKKPPSSERFIPSGVAATS